MILRRLQQTDEDAFLVAISKTKTSDPNFTFYYDPTIPFAEYLLVLNDKEQGIGLPEGHVPSTLLFGFVENTIVGRLSIRHCLNNFLSTIGGHIGYVTIEEYRRRGYGTEMLRQSLRAAWDLGLKRVLLTCDEDNIASQKIIEKCGGVYENSVEVFGSGSKITKRRYWIELKFTK